MARQTIATEVSRPLALREEVAAGDEVKVTKHGRAVVRGSSRRTELTRCGADLPA